MAIPFSPSELQECVVLPEDDQGIALVKAHVIFPVFFTAFMEYAFSAPDAFSAAFAADLCSITGTRGGEAPMAIPTPNQWRENVAFVNGDKCEKFRQSLNSGNLFSDWVTAVWNEDKSFTDEFKAQVLSIKCPQTGTIMAVPPVSAFKALIPPAGGSMCDKFYNATLFNELVAQVFGAIYQESRLLTPGFKASYCALGCVSGNPNPPGGAIPDAPTVYASISIPGVIRLAWGAAAGAVSYRVYRERGGIFYPMAETTAVSFDDTAAAVNTPTRYEVQAISSTGALSVFSNVATGLRPS